MKKLVMTAAVLACAASVVTAQTVTSANMVGYAKFNAIRGQLSLVALNFEPSTNLVASIIGDQLPTGTSLFIWDKTADTYRAVTKATRGGWGTSVINLGESFWVKVPTTAPNVTNTVILSGEVLLSDTNSVAVNGLDATGFYYPVDIAWGNTALSAQLANGSTLYLWNGSAYVPFTKATRGGWGTGATEIISPTTGFWVKSATSINWNEPRPFNVD